MFSIVQPFNREGKSCEKCIKRPGCSEHGSCINTYGTSDTSDDMMEALACHCSDPSKWTGALCDKGEMDIISILRLTLLSLPNFNSRFIFVNYFSYL